MLENDCQILNIVSHLTYGAFLDLFISHVVNQPVLEEGRIPFEFLSELKVVQNSEHSTNKGSRVALDECLELYAQQTSVQPRLTTRDATTSSYVEEAIDENIDAE